MSNTKIATCCYCGARAALTLRGKERHELACSTCGAPLHELKMLRSDARGERELVKPSAIRSHHPRNSKKHRGEPKKRRRQKSFAQRFLEEAWDAAEDVVEEVFDIFD